MNMHRIVPGDAQVKQLLAPGACRVPHSFNIGEYHQPLSRDRLHDLNLYCW